MIRTSPLRCILAVCTFCLVFPVSAYCQWERLPGPYGGSVQQLEQDGNDLYAYTTGGIFKSNADGANWSLLKGSETQCGFKPALSWFYKYLQVEAGIIWLIKPEEGLLRSKDGGLSWSTMFIAQLTNEVLQSCFVAGDTVFVSSNRALYRSVNGGISWSTVPDPNYYGPVYVQSKIKDAFIGRRDRSIQVSLDGGWQWTNVFTIAPKFAAVATVDSTIYGMYSSYARLIRSNDLGNVWKTFDTDSIHFEIYDTGAPGWLAGTGNDLFFATENGCHHASPRLFYSSNSGQTWGKAQQQNLKEQQLRDMYCSSEGLYIAAMDGVYHSSDRGTTFHARSSGMNASWINEVFQTPDNKRWAVARQGVFRSSDEGLSWEEVFPNRHAEDCGDVTRVLRTNKRMIFPELNACAFMYSEDNGNTWSASPIPPFTYCSEIATTTDAVWLRSYGGPPTVWYDNDPQPTVYTMPFLDKVYEIQSGNGTLLMAGLESIFISKDQGKQWQELPVFQYLGSSPRTGLHWAMDQYSVYRWNAMPVDTIFKLDYTENIWRPYFPVHAITGDTFKRHEISMLQLARGVRWMGIRNRGLFFSTIENPDIWYPFEPQLPGKSPKSVLVLDDGLWVGTVEAGIFYTPLQFHTPETPAPHFSVYPNPGKGSPLHIESDQFFAEGAYLRVFDVAGRLVREQGLGPGQQWALDFSALSIGLHILQFSTDKHLAALKWVKQQ